MSKVLTDTVEMRMSPFKLAAATLLLGASTFFAADAATAAPLASAVAAVKAQGESSVVEVQFRRRPRRGGINPGVGAAIGAAAIIGGIIAAQSEAEAAARRDAVGYCMSRFRSYDPETGTYIGRDGRVRRCP